MLPATGKQRNHTWFVYVIRVKNGKRDLLMSYLNQSGIQNRPYFPVIHLQPLYRKLFKYRPGAYPVAERVASETLALPIYVGLEEKQVKYIVETIKKFMHEK